MTPIPTRREVWVGGLLYPGHTLPTAAAPALVAVGLAIRDGVFAPLPALAAFVVGWLVQLGGVITDNYHNLRRHPDDQEHPELVTALAVGVVALGEIRRAAAWCYFVALVPGLYLVYVGGLPALLIGLASIAASLAYSSDPFPFGDRALGDPLFFLFFGIVSVAATYYVQAMAHTATPFPLGVPAGTLPLAAVVAGVPIAALITNILVIDNIRDLDHDRSKGEITIAVLLGPRWSRVEYAALLGLAFAVPVAMWRVGGFGAPVLLPLLSLPYALLVARRVMRASSYRDLLPLTPQAGQVLLLYSLLFGIGLAY